MDSHCASRTSFPTVAVACAPKAVNEVGRPCEVQGGELVARFELVQQMRTSRPELIMFCVLHNAKATTAPVAEASLDPGWNVCAWPQSGSPTS